VYAVTPRDIGRRIACRKCNAVLIIDEQGLRYETPPAPAATEENPLDIDVGKESPRPKKSRPLQGLGTGIGHWFANLPEGPTLLFTFGALLVITFLFMPIIGKAKVDRRQGTLEEEKYKHDQEVKILRTKPGNDTKVKLLEEEWPKLKEDLDVDIKKAEIDIKRSVYLDRYGLLLGFLILAIGSIRMMAADQPPMKRIVGAVVVTAQMLFVFLSFIIRG